MSACVTCQEPARRRDAAPLASSSSSPSPSPSSPARSRPRSLPLSIVSSTLLVLLPKCPLCIVGWLGALGFGSYAIDAMMIPSAVLVLFGVSQAVFVFALIRCSRGRSHARHPLV